MNAMSALYHIAQNDPPALTTDGWCVIICNLAGHRLHIVKVVCETLSLDVLLFLVAGPLVSKSLLVNVLKRILLIDQAAKIFHR